MKMIVMDCPHCGAEITGDANADALKCTYCGSSVPIEHKEEEAVERFVASESSEPEVSDEINEHVSYSAKKEMSCLAGCFWSLILFFVFPVPATYFILRKKSWGKGVRILLIIFVWLLYGLFAMIGASEK